MQTITVKNGQCFLDLAMQHAGSAEEAFNLCVQAGMPITQDFEAGTMLAAPSIVNSDVVAVYASTNSVPASVVSNASNVGGIGFWQIQGDFVIQ